MPQLQPASRRAPRSSRASRRSCSCSRTWRSPIRTSAARCAARSTIPRWLWWAAVGATGVRSIAWWDGEISSAASVQRYQRYGGGEIAAFAWKRHDPAPAEVDVVDGRLMVLSPWAVRDAALRRGAQPGLRLRARLLPAGAGRRTPGDHGRSARGVPDPIAQGASPTPTSGSRGTSRRARGGRAGFPGAPPARGAGRSARAAPRPSARQRARSPIPRSTRSTRRCAPLERALDAAHRELRPGGSPRRSAG